MCEAVPSATVLVGQKAESASQQRKQFYDAAVNDSKDALQTKKRRKKVDVFEILRWAVDFWGVEAD